MLSGPGIGVSSLVMVASLLAIRGPIETYLSTWAAAAAFVISGITVYLAGLALFGRPELSGLVNLFKKIRVVFRRDPSIMQDEADDSLF